MAASAASPLFCQIKTLPLLSVRSSLSESCCQVHRRNSFHRLLVASHRLRSKASIRASTSMVSIALRLPSRTAATAAPSSGVISPPATASAIRPSAGTMSAAAVTGGRSRLIARDFRAGHARLKITSAARWSPSFASSICFWRMVSASPSARASRISVARFLEPAGRPGPPGLPCWKRPSPGLLSVIGRVGGHSQTLQRRAANPKDATRSPRRMPLVRIWHPSEKCSKIGLIWLRFAEGCQVRLCGILQRSSLAFFGESGSCQAQPSFMPSFTALTPRSCFARLTVRHPWPWAVAAARMSRVATGPSLGCPSETPRVFALALVVGRLDGHQLTGSALQHLPPFDGLGVEAEARHRGAEQRVLEPADCRDRCWTSRGPGGGGRPDLPAAPWPGRRGQLHRRRSSLRCAPGAPAPTCSCSGA